MNRRDCCRLIGALCLSGCDDEPYDGKVALTRDDAAPVTLNIPRAYLNGYHHKQSSYFVWVGCIFPAMTPTSDPSRDTNGIPVLIVNVGGSRTHAEIDYANEFPSPGTTPPAEMRAVERIKYKPPLQGSYEVTHLFNRTAEGDLIRYELTPGLRVGASRRFARHLELRYIFSPDLLAQKAALDEAIARLVSRFLIT